MEGQKTMESLRKRPEPDVKLDRKRMCSYVCNSNVVQCSDCFCWCDIFTNDSVVKGKLK